MGIICHKYLRISRSSKAFRLTSFFLGILSCLSCYFLYFIQFFCSGSLFFDFEDSFHYLQNILVSFNSSTDRDYKKSFTQHLQIRSLNSINNNFFCLEHLSSCCVNYSLNISFLTDPRVSWYITHSLFYFQNKIIKLAL